MRMKLIVAMVSDDKTDKVIEAARQGGATGATVFTAVHGQGLHPGRTFLGLELNATMSVVLFLVLETRARAILESIRDAARFDEEAGAGVAFQVAIEDAVGLATQLPTMRQTLGSEL